MRAPSDRGMQTFGLITFILMTVQLILGGGSVWFNGALFGGNPKAKLVWKYHRCVVFTLRHA